MGQTLDREVLDLRDRSRTETSAAGPPGDVRALPRSWFPARRDTLLAAAIRSGASADVVAALRGLTPGRFYESRAQVAHEIAGHGTPVRQLAEERPLTTR